MSSLVARKLITASLETATGFLATGCLAPATTGSLSGTVHGGQQPVVGSRVSLYSVGITGLKSASASLLIAGRPGVQTDSNGRTYVTTGAGGAFQLAGGYDGCADPTLQLYAVATGGNPGLLGTVDNAAIALAVSLGPCGNLSSATSLQINELTTVAFATSFSAFASDVSHVGVPANNAYALMDAAVNAGALVSSVAGVAFSKSGTSVTPTATINSLGNSLAACVNSPAASSDACNSLFTATTSSGNSAPTDTFTATLAIANHPAANVTSIFALAAPTAPFQPSLTQKPEDWTLASGLPAPSSTTTGLIAIGDSITTLFDGNGASPATSGFTQLLSNALGGPLNAGQSPSPYSQGGDQAVDASQKAWFRAAPTNTGNPLMTLMIGTNDIYFNDQAATNDVQEQIFHDALMSTLSVWLTLPANKLFPSYNPACVGANWWQDGSYPNAVNGASVYTNTVGSPFTCTYQTFGGPVYFWHALDTVQGSGTVTIDGSLCANFANSPAGFSASHNGVNSSIAAIRCPVAAGTHTVTVMMTGGSVIQFGGLGTPAAAPVTTPRMYVWGPLREANDANATATNLYAKLSENLAAQMAADGYLVQYVNVRDHVLYTGSTNPGNAQAPGLSCMTDALHPNNCGHAQIASVLAAAILKSQ